MQEYSKKEAAAYLSGRMRSANELVATLSEGEGKKEDAKEAIMRHISSEVGEILSELPKENRKVLEIMEREAEALSDKTGDYKVRLERIGKILLAMNEIIQNESDLE